ncbi:hypothetical protein KSP35_21545 [Aquihabitans sp. G128]|uniref:DUF2188 domain-containing protein n=1 Tax=Aquihabitans sp. G128 TaxID=2849779 RepID=UPI001C22869C|nr:DUF2188 domain-containing protein [Aquihabitans sp. G128]QXC60873.1 hypothetical protein KSP35_21545 [Aquihabitans sp. G128]
MAERDIHVVEQGDGWEVWRIGDSMPLGSYVTLGEAEEQAQAQAALDGVAVVDHDAGFEATSDPTPPTEA